MNILVFGAGVLGSLYAAKLQRAGQHVTLLARGARLEDLRKNGIRLIDDANGVQTTTQVELIDQLKPDAAYDLMLVIVRKNQLPSLLPALARNHFTPNVLFMTNNAAGPAEMISALGRHRVLLGFTGAGGARIDEIVHYQLTSAQHTTIGELDGSLSLRILKIGRVLEEAGFQVAVCSNMDAWLKTHAAIVSPAANAIYMAGGDAFRLARTRDALILLVRAAHEGLRVLRKLGYPIIPARIRRLRCIPEPLLVAILAKGLASEAAQLMLARHANAARDEMQCLADEFKQLAVQSGLATPAIDRLAGYIDLERLPASDGQRSLPLDWRGVIAAVGALAALTILIGWILFKNRRGSSS